MSGDPLIQDAEELAAQAKFDALPDGSVYDMPFEFIIDPHGRIWKASRKLLVKSLSTEGWMMSRVGDPTSFDYSRPDCDVHLLTPEQLMKAAQKLEQANHALRADNLSLQKDLAWLNETNQNLREVLDAKTYDFHRRTIGDALAGMVVGAFVTLVVIGLVLAVNH